MTDGQPIPTTPPQLDDYLRERLAPRFRELVRAAEQRVASAQHALDDLQAAQGTVAWEITSTPPVICYINLGNGEMRVAAQPASEPFMTISQSATDWARFTTQMAGMFGADSRRPLGRSRIERVRALNGAVRFVLNGFADGGSWTCTMYFGVAPRPAEPQTTVTLAADTVAKVQAGQLDPQAAFVQGQVRIAGDMGFAMQLGMALFM